MNGVLLRKYNRFGGGRPFRLGLRPSHLCMYLLTRRSITKVCCRHYLCSLEPDMSKISCVMSETKVQVQVQILVFVTPLLGTRFREYTEVSLKAESLWGAV